VLKNMEFCFAKLQLKQYKQRHPCRKTRLLPLKAQICVTPMSPTLYVGDIGEMTQLWVFLCEASYLESEASLVLIGASVSEKQRPNCA